MDRSNQDGPGYSHSLLRVVIFVAILLFSLQGRAEWEPANGPFGGQVNCLASNEAVVLAGTGKGIYRSADGGLSWHEANQGLTYAWTGIYSLAISNGWIYAGTAGGYVYRSADLGLSWTGRHIGVSPDSPVISLCSRGDSIFAGTENGLFVSTDFGQNWAGSGQGLQVMTVVNSILSAGTTLFIATDHGLYRSFDGGAGWSAVNQSVFINARSLAAAGDAIIVATGDGVFRSRDNGETWVQKSAGLDGHPINSMEAHGTGLFACTEGGGIFFSADTAEHWNPVNNGLICKNISSLTVNGSLAFAGTVHGVARSADNAANWNFSNNGLIRARVNSVSAVGQALFAMTGSGLYRSVDHGMTWDDLSGNLAERIIGSVTGSGNKLFAASDSVYRSADNGTSWTGCGSGPGAVGALTISGATLFAGTYLDGVYASENFGDTWIVRNQGMPGSTDVRSFAMKGTKLFAATNRGAYYSEDNGITWSNAGLTESITRVLTDSTGIYVISDLSGVLYSADGGPSWEPLSASLGDAPVISAAVRNGMLFVSNRDGIFVTYDMGRAYFRINSGLPELNKATLFADSLYLYAGGMNTGIWRRQLKEFTGMEDAATSSDFRVFPNPVVNMLNLTNPGMGGGVAALRDLSGKVLMQWPLEQGTMTIDVSPLAGGVYVLTVTKGTTHLLFRIVKI